MSSSFVCRLPSRALLRVRGAEVADFLQGLFTNDVQLLKPGGSQFGCFLHFSGRVLCDAMLYHSRNVHDGQSSVLIDVHQEMESALMDQLMEYKLRRKVVIESVSDSLSVVVARGEEAGVGLLRPKAEIFADPRTHILSLPPSSSSSSSSSSQVRGVDAPKDTPEYGLCSFLPGEAPPPHDVEASQQQQQQQQQGIQREDVVQRLILPSIWAPPRTSTSSYDALLVSHGVGEGPNIFRSGKTLPFEGNLDYLSGISYHKGCYVGQELTHRTHVMLVARKRTVPIIVGEATTTTTTTNDADDVLHAPVHGAQVGDGLFIRGGKERVGEINGLLSGSSGGLALLRLRYVSRESHTIPDLSLADGTPVKMHLPAWWPRRQIKKMLKNN